MFKIQLFCTILLKQVCFAFILTCSYYYAQQMNNTNAWVQIYVWVKFRRIVRKFKIQLFCTVLLKQVCIPFILTCSYYYAQQMYNTNAWVQIYVWVKFHRILRTFKIQLFSTVLLNQVCFPFILTFSYYYAQQIYNTNALIQTNVWFKFPRILRTFKIELFCTVLLKQVCFPFILTCSYYFAQENLTHKCFDLDQRLGQVSPNSENVQNLAVLHGFTKARLFHFYTNLQLLFRLGKFNTQMLGSRPTFGSSFVEF